MELRNAGINQACRESYSFSEGWWDTVNVVCTLLHG